jgi:acyl-CoA hydrolase
MELKKPSPPSQRATKTVRESAFLTRKIVGPDQLNPNGTLFGGVMMAWIDEVAFMSARRYSGRPFVVTASIDNITFLAPLRSGDHAILTSQVNYVGRSSMEIGVKVENENPYTGERTPVTSAYLTFVALDKRGKPKSVPRLVLETPEDHRRHEEAAIRVKVRDRLRRHLRKKYERAQKQQAETISVPSSKSPAKSALPLKIPRGVQQVLDRYGKATKESLKRLKITL